jgi:hypothetical protein
MAVREAGAALDEMVARALVERGVVSDRAIAHARAVKRRGFTDNPLGEILIELEHVTSEALVGVLAEISGARIWDGAGVDPAVMQDGRMLRGLALPLRREGGTIVYATLAPHDESLREDVRAMAGAMRAEPLCASAEQIARARGWPTKMDAVPGGGKVSRNEWPARELELRERWEAEHDDPVVRLTNLFLIDQVARMPGAVVRLEATEPPRVMIGRCGEIGEAVIEGGSGLLVQSMIWRLRQMAAGPPGGGSYDNWIVIKLGRGVTRNFQFRVEPTERGEVAIVQRGLPWYGLEPPASPEWSAYRAALDESWRAVQEDRLDLAEYARRATLAAAERIGAEALLEVVSSLIQLAAVLDRQRRESEARPFAERALELAMEHGLGGRVVAEIAGLLGCIHVDDLEKRVEWFERAEAGYRAPGPAMGVSTYFAIEIAAAERSRGRAAASLAAAERALADDRRWYGATTKWGRDACAYAALACAALERADAAQGWAREALRVGEAMGEVDEEVRAALGAAALARGDWEGAVRELRAQRAMFGAENAQSPNWVWGALDLARAHEALGQLGEARAVASWGRGLALEPSNALAHRGLEELLARAGPYR